MVIVDETHYGSHSPSYGKSIGLSYDSGEISEAELKELKKEAKEGEIIENRVKSLNPRITLQCSGTPYYILASGEFGESIKNKTIITDTSFSDMINARDQWLIDNPNEKESKSPYFGIPNIIKFGMNLTKECRKVIEKNPNLDTKLAELFKNNRVKFSHEDAIIELMSSIFGANNHKIPGFLDEQRIKNGEIFKHIIIVLPHIDDCNVLKKLLIDKKIVDENEREVIVAVERREGGDKYLGLDPRAADSRALNNTLNELEKQGKRSLTITVNRFLTGVSVPLWDAMFYMKDTKSPQEYDQAIFRLCTRNVGNIKDEDTGDISKICRKSNVYLIDFKIDRMYNMMIESAIAQCSAQKKSRPDDVKKVLEQNLASMPVYSEIENVYGSNRDEILGKMKQINPDDLLRVYVNYNKTKSIEDSINIKQFGKFLSDGKNLDILKFFSEGKLNQGGKEQLKNQEGDQTIGVPEYQEENQDQQNGENRPSAGMPSGGSSDNTKKVLEELQNKFTDMLKKVLYSSICLSRAPKDIDDFIKIVEENEGDQKICRDFRIDFDGVKKAVQKFNYQEKMEINMLIYQVEQLLDDGSIDPIDRVMNAVGKLGQIDKNEVVTPKELAKKMVDKLGQLTKDQCILEVNSKYGEFLIQIYKKFGHDVANNVKVVASSEMTKSFIRKVLNILQLDEQNLMNLEDWNKNGRYDIQDFIFAPDEKLIEECTKMKFDCCLMNPPYPTFEQGGMYLDMQFIEKANMVSKLNIAVYPGTRFFSKTKIGEKNHGTGHLYSVDFFNANEVFGINTQWQFGGIYVYDNDNIYDQIICNNSINTTNIPLDLQSRKHYYDSLSKNPDVLNLFNKLKNIYDTLLFENNTMVNDKDEQFIYEENGLQRGKTRFNVNKPNNVHLNRVKQYLKTGEYKYCIYKGSFNHSYDKPQEWLGQDPDKIFKGQICWLTNKENVKNNMIYWMECPLFDFWRKFIFYGWKGSTGCCYGYLPALDFDKHENEFKEYVNNLYHFNKDDIKVLKEFEVHGADTL